MKKQSLEAFYKLMLRKRSIIETINDQLKNCFDLEHSRHRSLPNFLANIVASLIAYSFQDKKPSLDLRNANFCLAFKLLSRTEVILRFLSMKNWV